MQKLPFKKGKLIQNLPSKKDKFFNMNLIYTMGELSEFFTINLPKFKDLVILSSELIISVD